MNPALYPYKVAIIGAGPAGCALARILLTSSFSDRFSVIIFEGEASPKIRSQGGTLDLHSETGLLAIRKAGLYEEFLRLARFDGEALTICDKQLRRYLSIGPSAPKIDTDNARPEIDREQLRHLLLDSLPADVMRWGWRLRCINVNATSDSKTLLFENGQTATGFDLIVGADGAWSKVRSVLMPHRPFYSGVGGHNMIIPQVAARRPAIHRLLRQGSLFAYSDGTVVMGQQMGDGSVYVSVYSVLAEDWMQEASYDVHDGRQVKANYCQKLQEHWHPDLVDLVRAASADPSHITARSIFAMPIGLRWRHHPQITLMGDAAHLMTPFVGYGANSALKDAVDLAQVLLDGVADGEGVRGMDTRVEHYEQIMVERTRKAQQLSWDMMRLMLFEAASPHTTIERYLIRYFTEGMGTLRAILVGGLVYAYYFVFKAFTI